MGCGFLHQVIGYPDEYNVVYEFIFVQNFFDPATTAENIAESGFLHVGVVVKNDKRKRFLDHVGPDFAHVVVIAVVDKVDARCVVVACFVELCIDCLNRLVVAVAVCAADARKV